LSSASPCLTCHGSGAKPGTSPKVCGTCHGAGMTQRTQGAFGFAEPCPDCGGTGSKIDDPCTDCRGSGVTDRIRTINVKVPAGVQDGQRIRLSGQGEAGFRGAPSGDLYVTVTVQKDAVFQRDGADLLVDLPVSYPELVRGARVSVPTLTGRVTVKVPAGFQAGERTRLSVQAGAWFRDAPSGALYVTATVQKDAVFQRAGADLLVDLPVSYPERVRGARVSAPPLTGRVTVKVPAGSRDGQVLRVRGRGIARKSGTGDRKVTLSVATPPAGMAEEELVRYEDALREAGFDPRSGWAGSS